MSSQSSPLGPTWQGHIASTLDALILFEASLEGLLNHVPRRPHDRERQDLIMSGSVFIYEEHSSGIKRWTDGVSWSPSRILGNFLIYRELERPFPPGEKKRALKKKKCSPTGINKHEGTNARLNVGSFVASGMEVGKDTERSLIGSLIDSYPFKSEGLVKKTISITYRGVPHHLVSYYSVEDVMSGNLMTPSKDHRLKEIVPRMELMTSQNFRAPVDEVEYGPDGAPTLFSAVPNGSNDFAHVSGSILQRAWNPTMQTVPVPQYAATQPTFPFPPTSHHAFATPMNSSMGVPMAPSMPSPLSSSLTSPTPTPMAPPNLGSMSFAPQPQGNFAMDPSRTARFGSAAGIAHDYSRNVPTHSPPRRNSAFEATPSSDLTAMALGSMAEARAMTGTGNSYLPQPTYYLGPRQASMSGQDNQTFQSPRKIKMEPNGVSSEDGASQQYGMDEGATTWTFEPPIDSAHDQFFNGGSSSGSSQPWANGTNHHLGRN